MSLEDRRAAAVRFLEGMSEGRIIDEIVTDDFEAWSLNSGVIPGEKFRLSLKLLTGLFPDGFRIWAVGTTAEDDRVVVQAQSKGVLKTGELYENRYLLLMTFVGDKVARYYEYTDTKKVVDLLYPLMAEWIAAKAAMNAQ